MWRALEQRGGGRYIRPPIRPSSVKDVLPMPHWNFDATRALLLVGTVCLFGQRATADEIITHVLYVDDTYVSMPMTVAQETRSFIITRAPHGMSMVVGARLNIPKQNIRYLIMDDSAVPYAGGAAQTPVRLARRTVYPKAGLLPFAIGGAGFALWQLKRHRDAGTEADVARQIGRSDLAREIATAGDRHLLYAIVSFAGAAIAAIAGLESRAELHLGDGAVIRLHPDDTYRFRVMARKSIGLTVMPGFSGPGIAFTLR